MDETKNKSSFEIFEYLSQFVGILVALSGFVILLGWQFNILVLKSASVNFIPANPITAVCFICLGIAYSLHKFNRNNYSILIADILAFGVLSVALIRLLSCYGIIHFRIDKLLFVNNLGENSMAFLTALIFVFLSTALLTLRFPRNFFRITLEFLAIGLICLIIVGYFIYPDSLHDISFFTEMPVISVIILALFITGMFTFDLNYGFMRILTHRGVPGELVRRLLPRSILILLLLTWFFENKHLGVYGVETGELFHLCSIIMILVLLIWNVGLEIEKIDSDRQKKDRALIENAARLKTATQSAKMGVWEWDIVANTKIWDSQMFALYGAQADVSSDPIKVWEKSVHPQDILRVMGELKKAINGEKEYDTEFRVIWPDRSTHYIKAYGLVLREANGVASKMIGVNWDITEKKKNEKALYDQKFALDQHAIVAITDTKGKITYVNDKFCETSKYSRDEILGQTHRLVNSGYHPKAFFKDLWDTIGSGKVWVGEIKNKSKDGKYYWVHATIVPFLDDNGKPYQYVAIRADITALKEAEEQLETQKVQIEKVAQELARSNTDLEQFAYVASHDLQEPLRMVASFTQLLEKRYKDKLDEKAKEYIDFAVDGAKRMQGLIDDLLMFSRAGQRDVAKNSVDLKIVCWRVIKDLEALLTENKAVINIGEMPIIVANETQMNQLFLNLISNAIKYRSENPPIVDVTSKKNQDGEWQFSVADNGIGIEEKYFDKLFIIFQRLHTRKHYKGTGIGLALCKKIVENYGGRIWLESTFGKGTTFHFTLKGELRGSNETN